MLLLFLLWSSVLCACCTTRITHAFERKGVSFVRRNALYLFRHDHRGKRRRCCPSHTSRAAFASSDHDGHLDNHPHWRGHCSEVAPSPRSKSHLFASAVCNQQDTINPTPELTLFSKQKTPPWMALDDKTNSNPGTAASLFIDNEREYDFVKTLFFQEDENDIGARNTNQSDKKKHGVDLLGPPEFLSNLPVGGKTIMVDLVDGAQSLQEVTTTKRRRMIERLADSPDMFVIRNFVDPCQWQSFMEITLPKSNEESSSSSSPWKVAGTRQSSNQHIRQKSFLQWLSPDEHPLIRKTSQEAENSFLFHSYLPISDAAFCSAEDWQVAMYEPQGSFGFHHDDFGRFVTVLTYLNGVGGTYFPFANNKNHCDWKEDEELNSLTWSDYLEKAASREPGKDGLLVVGKEGLESYIAHSLLPTNHEELEEDGPSSPRRVVKIEPGDALLFYNYNGKSQSDSSPPQDLRDYHSIHASLTVPEEKWIATGWWRSEALTGPFHWLLTQEIRQRHKEV